MTVWQQSILFKPVILGAFFGIVWWVKRVIYHILPDGKVREALYRSR